MALASGQWINKEVAGEPPSCRYGHAIAAAGNIVFFFGGASNINSPDNSPIYLNDFYVLTVTSTSISWEMVPQSGAVPTAREGHTLCVVKGKIYLFGGSSSPQSKECLPGIFCFDIVPLMWEKLKTSGISPRTLMHSSAVVGDNIYVFGGIVDNIPTDDLLMFNTVSNAWTPVKTTGFLPSARFNHRLTEVNNQIYLLGGCSADKTYYMDVYVLNTDTLEWQKCDVKGDCPLDCSGHTITAHRDKDIYLFGGKYTGKNGAVTSINEIHKLSIAKMKWKVPLYVGIPPARRHKHASFILHSHIYIFGGRNEEQEFNDLKVMKLINPSERQPVIKEILSEFGIRGVSTGFAPTKIPNLKYELSKPPFHARPETPPPAKVTSCGDYKAVRNEAMDMIQKAFSMVDQEFQRLDCEKSELTQAAFALEYEREAYRIQHEKQQQELQEMLDRHKAQNEAWLRARAEENDRERKELCKLQVEIQQEQEKLRKEQSDIEKRNEHLVSIMQQFKGM